MIRVHFADAEPIDVAANQSQVGAAGELILNECELGQRTDPVTFQPTTFVRALQWRCTFGPRSGWTWVEPVDNEAPLPALLEAMNA